MFVSGRKDVVGFEQRIGCISATDNNRQNDQTEPTHDGVLLAKPEERRQGYVNAGADTRMDHSVDVQHTVNCFGGGGQKFAQKKHRGVWGFWETFAVRNVPVSRRLVRGQFVRGCSPWFSQPDQS